MRRRLAVLIFVLAALLAVLAVVSLETRTVEHWLAVELGDFLSKRFGVLITIRDIKVALLESSIELVKPTVKTGGGQPEFEADSIRIKLRSLQSFLGDLHAEEVVVASPQVRVRLAGRNSSLGRHKSPKSQALEKVPQFLGGKRFRLGRLKVTNGTLWIALGKDFSARMDNISLNAAGTENTYKFRITSDKGLVSWKNINRALERLSITGRLKEQELDIEKGALVLAESAVFYSLSLNLAAPHELSADLILHSDITTILTALGSHTPLAGRFSASLKLKANEHGFDVKGFSNLMDVKWDARRLGDLRFGFTSDGSRLYINNLSFKTAGGLLSASARMDTSFPSDVAADLDFKGLSARKLMEELGRDSGNLDADLSGRLAIRTVLSKNMTPVSKTHYELKAEVSRLGTRQAGHAFDISTQAKGFVEGTRLWIERCSLFTAGLSLELAGSVDTSTAAIDLEIKNGEGNLDYLDRLFGPGTDWSGRISFQGLAGGTLLEPKVWLDISAGNLSVPGLEPNSTSLKGEVVVDARTGRLVVPSLNLSTGDSKLSIKLGVKLEPPFDIKADAELLEIAVGDVVRAIGLVPHGRPKITGWLQGHISIQGTLDDPKGIIELRSKSLSIAGEGPTRFHLVSEFKQKELSISKAVLSIGDGRLAATGTFGIDGKMNITAKMAGIDLSRIHCLTEQLPDVKGFLNGSAWIHGDISSPQGNGVFVLNKIRLGDLQQAAEDSRLVWNLGDGMLFLEGNVLGRKLSFSSQIELSPKLPFWLVLTTEKFKWGKVQKLPFSGSLSGRLDLSGPLLAPKSWQGRLDLSRLELHEHEFGVLSLVLSGPFQGRITSGNMEVSNLRIDTLGGKLTLGGTISADKGWDMSISGDIETDFLVDLVPSVFRKADGKAKVRGTIRGRLPDPSILITTDVSNLEIMFQGFPHVLEETEGRVLLSSKRVVLDRVRARLGGGTTLTSGEIDLNPFQIHLHSTLDECSIAVPKDIPARVAGDFMVDGNSEKVRFSGDLDLLWARISKDFRLRDVIPKLKRLFEPKRLALPSNDADSGLELDIRLQIKDSLFIKNNMADIELSGHLTVTGTTNRVGLLGTLHLVRGKLRFQRHELELKQMYLDFTNRFKIFPWFDIRAKTRLRDFNPIAEGQGGQETYYDVEFQVQGNLDKYELRAVSEPPLPEEDILSLLLIGVKTTDLGSNTEGGAEQALSQITSDALMELTGLDRQLRETLKLDFIRLSPGWAKGEKGGYLIPYLQVGKQLTDDLLLILETGVGDTKDQRVRVEYRFNPHLDLLGQWENSEILQSGNFGLELRYRKEF